MSNVIHATFTPKTTDGGKARILAHRYAINLSEPVFDWRFEDLTMDHADPEEARSELA
jgi:hypothetical protein